MTAETAVSAEIRNWVIIAVTGLTFLGLVTGRLKDILFASINNKLDGLTTDLNQFRQEVKSNYDLLHGSYLQHLIHLHGKPNVGLIGQDDVIGVKPPTPS